MKKVLMLVAVMGSMMFATQASAQLSSLTSVIPGDSGADPSSSVSQESIVQSYVAANLLVLNATEKFAKAFGLKKQAAAVRAEADALQSGSTTAGKNEFKSSVSVSDKAMAAVQAKMDEGAVMSEEGKGNYIEGLGLAAESVMATKDMADDAKTFATAANLQIKSASMMQKLKVTKKVSAGMFVAKELPGYTSRLVANLGKVTAYAKSADIPVPEDATAAL